MIEDRPLMQWLSGERYYQKSPYHIVNEDYNLTRIWISITLSVPLHEVGKVKLLPISKTWDQTLIYINAACKKLNRSMPGWAPPKDEADKILAELGPPPLRCYALYFITVGDAAAEHCVYVGQTDSKHQRFKAGHAAFNKLHAPEYASLSKRVYFAGLIAEDDDDHVFPVEWVHPEHRRKTVLDYAEARMIFDLQPILNKKGRKAERAFQVST